MSARDRVQAYLDQLTTLRGYDQEEPHNINGVPLLTADLQELIRLTAPEPGQESYLLRDRDGDWWLYLNDRHGFVHIRFSGGEAEIAYYDGYSGFVAGSVDEAAAKIVENWGVWA